MTNVKSLGGSPVHIRASALLCNQALVKTKEQKVPLLTAMSSGRGAKRTHVAVSPSSTIRDAPIPAVQLLWKAAPCP